MNHLSAGRSFRVGRFNLSAEMRIYNLFNESYQTILYRPMPGRHYHLVLMFKI
jgi:iron complex outermembrane receptor protein